MRVITGTARGRRLLEPEGMDTRPTTDRVKEGIFSSIQFEIEGRRVLDLFGGTGQMGIEALSRGAAHCTFLDLRKEAEGVIRENLKRTGFAEEAAAYSRELGPLFEARARANGWLYLNAASVAHPSARDRLHMEAEDHRALAQALARIIKGAFEGEAH